MQWLVSLVSSVPGFHSFSFPPLCFRWQKPSDDHKLGSGILHKHWAGTEEEVVAGEEEPGGSGSVSTRSPGWHTHTTRGAAVTFRFCSASVARGSWSTGSPPVAERRHFSSVSPLYSGTKPKVKPFEWCSLLVGFISRFTNLCIFFFNRDWCSHQTDAVCYALMRSEPSPWQLGKLC